MRTFEIDLSWIWFFVCLLLLIYLILKIIETVERMAGRARDKRERRGGWIWATGGRTGFPAVI
jgi:hypothetical protein